VANLMQLRLAAREIFDGALQAVNIEAALRRAFRIDGARLTVDDSTFELSAGARFYSVALGKAAVAMAQALEDVLHDRLRAG